MADADDRPIGTAEAATILGRSQRSVQRGVNTGAIPILRKLDNRRGDLLFSQKAIEELAKKGTPPTP